MADLGARQAINLDGGGSTALIHHGHLLNRPYDAQDRPSSTRAVATAAIFHAAPLDSRGRIREPYAYCTPGCSVAAEPFACAFVVLIAEVALVVEVAKLSELVCHLFGCEVLSFGVGARGPPAEPVGVDAELAQPGTHPLDAEATGGEAVGVRPRERPSLHEPAVGRQDCDRGADLERARYGLSSVPHRVGELDSTAVVGSGPTQNIHAKLLIGHAAAASWRRFAADFAEGLVRR